MTTTPNPTAAEMAVRWAENQLAGAARSLVIEHVARGILDLTAQLAESERARATAAINALEEYQRRMRKEPACQRVTDESMHAAAFVCGRLIDEYKAQLAALAADRTTARESAENTAEETMTEQSDGCLTITQLDEAFPERLGNTGSTWRERWVYSADFRTGFPPLTEVGERHRIVTSTTGYRGNSTTGVFRGDGWETAAGGRILWHKDGGTVRLWASETAQTPEPVEPPIDEPALRALYDSAPGGHDHGLRAVYRSGLAAGVASEEARLGETIRFLNAENAGLKNELERVRAELEKANAAVEHNAAVVVDKQTELALTKVELEQTQAGLADAQGLLAKRTVQRNEARTELTTLRAQPRARRVPTIPELAAELRWASLHQGCVDPATQTRFAELTITTREYWCSIARAAMTALGFQDSPGASPERETDVTVRDEVVCVGAPASEAAGGIEAVLRAGTQDGARPAAERRGGDDAPQAARGEGLRGQSGAVASGGSGSAVDPKQRNAARPSPLVTSDNEPPVPDREALEAEGFSFAWPPDSEMGELHELQRIGTRIVTRYDGLDSGEEGSAPVWGEGSWYMGAHGSVVAWRRAQQRAAEPTPAVTCTWAAYAGKNKVGCDQATDHPSGMCDQHRELAESFGRDVFPEATPWKPTVGERAVLLQSPCEMDVNGLGRVFVIDRLFPHTESGYFGAHPEDGDQTESGWRLHRDATWRPASAAPAKAEADVPTCIYPNVDHDGPCQYSPQPGGFLDALTRRVERIEAAMDVELSAYDMRIEREERSK